MFCKQCGIQVADGAPYCPGCGSKMEVSEGSVRPVLLPVAVQATPKRSKRPWVLMVLCMIVATAISVGVLAITAEQIEATATPESAAQAYALAHIESDMEALYESSAGDVRGAFENAMVDYEDERFESLVSSAEDAGLDVTVDNWDDCYSVMKEVSAVALADTYGEDYAISTEITYTEDMDEEMLEACRTLVTDDACIDYIDPDLITEGKFMVVELYIEGSEDYDYFDHVVPVVEYDGAWTAFEPDYYIGQPDYENNRDQRDAFELYQEAIANVQANVE